jgi:hypothetical protein
LQSGANGAGSSGKL